MPLWRIYAHPDTFTYDQKKGIAGAITKQYDILPAFYVNVIFVDSSEDNVWIGGEPRKNFVRIVVEQIARVMPSPDTAEGRAWRTGWMDRINEVRPTLAVHVHIKLTRSAPDSTPVRSGPRRDRVGNPYLGDAAGLVADPRDGSSAYEL